MNAFDAESAYVALLAAVGGVVLVRLGLKVANALPKARLKIGIERLEP